MSNQNPKEPVKVPTPNHPLFEHYCSSRAWKRGLLARKSLLRHIRADEEAVRSIVSSLATLEIAAMSNKSEWAAFFEKFSNDYGEHVLNQLITACQHWVMVGFNSPDEYHNDIELFVSMFVIQMAPNSIIPNNMKKDFRESEYKELLKTNPIVMFLSSIYIGGPLSNNEAKAMFKTPPPTKD